MIEEELELGKVSVAAGKMWKRTVLEKQTNFISKERAAELKIIAEEAKREAVKEARRVARNLGKRAAKKAKKAKKNVLISGEDNVIFEPFEEDEENDENEDEYEDEHEDEDEETIEEVDVLKNTKKDTEVDLPNFQSQQTDT